MTRLLSCIHSMFWFSLALLCSEFGPKIKQSQANKSRQAVFNQSEASPNQTTRGLVHPPFPALRTGCMFFLRVVIGQLWLVMTPHPQHYFRVQICFLFFVSRRHPSSVRHFLSLFTSVLLSSLFEILFQLSWRLQFFEFLCQFQLLFISYENKQKTEAKSTLSTSQDSGNYTLKNGKVSSCANRATKSKARRP